MTTVLFDCRAVAARYLDWVAREKDRQRRKPVLATVLQGPGRDPASLQYRDLIHKDAERLGIKAERLEVADEPHLLALLDKLNRSPRVSGVVVLYPLHDTIKDEDIMDRVSPRKDVEGLHSINLGYLIKYKRFLDEARQIKCVVPATAKAVVKLLQAYPEIRIEGAFATIVNNSMRVGKPLGLMLENLGATVVKCYDKTPREALEACVRRADILVTAVPAQGFSIDPSWVKPGAAVVDVSYQGNVDAAALDGRAAFVTSPDNRVGQVTRAMMFVNLAYCTRG